jgi:hypothetical protein
MFSLRFEIENSSAARTKSYFVVCADNYRANVNGDGTTDVVMNEDPSDKPVSCFTVGPNLEHYQRCFVMNAAGATIDTIKARSGGVNAAA